MIRSSHKYLFLFAILAVHGLVWADSSDPVAQMCKSSPTSNNPFCPLHNNPEAAAKTVQSAALVSVNQNFSQNLKAEYFNIIASSVENQYALTQWVGRLSTQDPSSRLLAEAMKQSQSSCNGPAQDSLHGIFTHLQGMDPAKELKINKLSAKEQAQQKQIFEQRLLLAWMESRRIQHAMTLSSVNAKDKAALRKKLQALHNAYPAIDDSEKSAAIEDLVHRQYGAGYNFYGTALRPDLDKILFADAKNGYAKINADSLGSNDPVIKKILTSSVPANVETALHKMMTDKLSSNFESIAAFCKLDPCQTISLSPATTFSSIAQLPKSDQTATLQAACTCNMSLKPTTYASSALKNTFDGLSIAGFSTCAFTWGVGCFVGAASSAGSIASSAANIYGAQKDLHELSPLVRTVSALPGLNFSDKDRVDQAQDKAKEVEKSESINVGVSVGIPVVGKLGSTLVKSGSKAYGAIKSWGHYATPIEP